MLTIDECKKHIKDLKLTDEEVEKVRDLLYAFVERTLDYCVETGMFVVANQSCDLRTHKEILKQQTH